MLKYSFERKQGVPLYEELYKALKADILAGRLRAGERLPSKRAMAEDNDISVTTVLNAYQQLITEGFITSSEKRGYFVAEIQKIEPVPETPRPFVGKYYKEDEWFADFQSNNFLYNHFPFAMWKKVIREILSEYDLELVRRGNPFGLEELRTQIAAFLYRSRGISVSPECVIIGAGIEYLYARLVNLFPEDTVYAVETPGYRKIPDIYDAYDLRWRNVGMDAHGIRMPELISSGANIVHVSPEHHYPLGTVMSVARRYQLLNWANSDENRYIIEDDYDCEFRYQSRIIPALKSRDSAGRVIYMNTFSKTLSPAVRISYMVLPEHLLQRYIEHTRFFTNSTSSLEQYAVARFLEKGYFERHLNRIRKRYRQEGEQLIALLQENKRIPIRSIRGGDSGTHVTVSLDTTMSDAELRKRSAEAGVHLSCLSDFCTRPDPRYDHVMVLNFSDMDEETQREAIRRLGEIF
ncbi:MAG: PLP-dependent aminotransferase family protein [Firmicutes bacterium]|nr:PLP-dependent aminotransferase family protein [Bacillota bacterium]